MLTYKSGSTGEALQLSGENIKAHIKASDLYDYDWQVEAIELQMGSKIKTFRKKAIEHELIIDFIGNKAKRKETANNFFEVIERDIIEKKAGRLYLNDRYKECYIIKAKNNGKQERSNIVRMTMGIYAPKQSWIKEVSFSFQKFAGGSESNLLEFPYEYPYEYTGLQKGMGKLENDHYANANFKMIIYGPVVNPIINIGDYPYEVNTTVEENEYLTIDSTKNTVERTLADGTIINEYNKRSFENSVFRPIPPGNNSVLWSGDFGWDITLYQERSEPKW